MIYMRRFVLTLILITCCQSTATWGAAGATKIPEEVEIYSRELNTFNNSATAGLGVEKLLKLGRDAANALIVPPNAGGPDVLESLSEDDFQVVIHKMKGFSVNRQETVFVDPIPSFFIALSKRAGDQVSQNFSKSWAKQNFHMFVYKQITTVAIYLAH